MALINWFERELVVTKYTHLLVVLAAAAGIGAGAWLIGSEEAFSSAVAVENAPPTRDATNADGQVPLDSPDSPGAIARAVDPSSARTVTVPQPVLEEATNGAVAGPPRPARVGGHIKLDSGLALAAVPVVLERIDSRETAWTRRVPHADVLPAMHDQFGAVATTSDEHGAFRFDDVEPGNYRVAVFERASILGREDPQAAPAWNMRLRSGEQRDDADFVLEIANTIAGRVLDANGQGLEGAEVSVRPFVRGATQRIQRVVPIASSLPSPMRTGAQGWFCFSGLARGDYIVHANRPRLAVEYAAKDSAPIGTGTANAAIFLPRLIDVSGVVRASDGSTSGHAGVIAKSADGREVGVTYADDQGRFSLQVPDDVEVDLFACFSQPLGDGRNGWSMSEPPASASRIGVRPGSKDVVLELSRSR
jgi:hypothetical protein